MRPVLWSFRRCPYAIRARLAVAASRVEVELREVVLRDKPAAFLERSPDGTVPLLDLGDRVVSESRDIMLWALGNRDPEGWLQIDADQQELIETCEGPFKAALDHTKYDVRYPDLDPEAERATAMRFIETLDARLADQPFLGGATRRLADMAILPFVRQFAHIDRDRFDAEAGACVRGWLDRFLDSELFLSVMAKRPPWQAGQAGVLFPGP